LKIVTLGTFISANMYEDRMNREQFRTTWIKSVQFRRFL
jgi:hypothetical protein